MEIKTNKNKNYSLEEKLRLLTEIFNAPILAQIKCDSQGQSKILVCWDQTAATASEDGDVFPVATRRGKKSHQRLEYLG